MKTLFISDLHFDHSDIISFDCRPFRNREHMWYSMVARWNNAVAEDDHVYILGDLFWDDDPVAAVRTLSHLNGKKHLIIGNHDAFINHDEVRSEFEEICDYEELVLDGEYLVLSHYPLASWKKMQGMGMNRRGAWIHLHGHVHMTGEYQSYLWYLDSMSLPGIAPLQAFNVGCMTPWMNYQPRTLEEIKTGFLHWKKGQKSEKPLLYQLYGVSGEPTAAFNSLLTALEYNFDCGQKAAEGISLYDGKRRLLLSDKEQWELFAYMMEGDTEEEAYVRFRNNTNG